MDDTHRRELAAKGKKGKANREVSGQEREQTSEGREPQGRSRDETSPARNGTRREEGERTLNVPYDARRTR